MKDAYSFDIDDEELNASYQAERDTYERIFQRLGLRYVIVAMSGYDGQFALEVPAPRRSARTLSWRPRVAMHNAEAVTPRAEARDVRRARAPRGAHPRRSDDRIAC